MAQPSSTKDSGNLDLLRAYAVLTVYFGHLFQTLGIERFWGGLTIFDFAQTGVRLFFVHTCLVLLLSLERSSFEGVRFFTNFYVRRVFRIYPLSIATVLLAAAVAMPDFPSHAYQPLSRFTLLSNAALVQNLTHAVSYPAVLWSLPFEVQMYLVLPFLFLLLQRTASLWVPVGLWCASAAVVLLLLFRGAPELGRLFEYVPCFLGGAIAYRLWNSQRRFAAYWVPILITIGVIGRAIGAAADGLDGERLATWLVCLALGLLLPRFEELQPGALRSAAATIAQYSYGIYLSHTVVFWIAFVLLRAQALWLQVLACASLTPLLPVLLYRAIEKPMIDFGIRLVGRTSRRQVRAEASAA